MTGSKRRRVRWRVGRWDWGAQAYDGLEHVLADTILCVPRWCHRRAARGELERYPVIADRRVSIAEGSDVSEGALGRPRKVERCEGREGAGRGDVDAPIFELHGVEFGLRIG